MEIANKIFDELIEMGYAVESNYKFSSPIVLAIYPDGKEPRLTGDSSGKDGVNAQTISVEPNSRFINLTTGTELKTAKKDCKIYNAENPQDIEFLKAVAAGDMEKHVIKKILSEYSSDSGSFCTVQWFGGETTEEPLHSVKHSEAYKLFSKNNKEIGKRTTSQRKSTSHNSTSYKRPRSSNRIRK
ncbi:hypothetical protein P9112_003550 [Eukaryota sp. TZLM1-RC]